MAADEAQSIPLNQQLQSRMSMAEFDSLTFDHSTSPHLQKPFSSPPTTSPSESRAAHHEYHNSDILDFADHVTTDTPDEEEDLITTSTGHRQLSGSSSISSFPTSIPREDIEDAFADDPLSTPTKYSRGVGSQNNRSEENGYRISSPRSGRGHVSGFRNPSSVKAMQMKDELYEDSDDITPRHRRNISRLSQYSHSSLGLSRTSPTKRSSKTDYPSPRKNSSKLRKEFPLVLLHCTLLPPSLALHATIYDGDLLAMILPEEYRKRWTLLQDRLLKDSEVKARGILIPHPQEDYELLEERLLESLDLEKPRIRNNHFFKNGTASIDSGFDSASQTEDESDFESESRPKCPDCGKKMKTELDEARNWDIKVYAANGLMRAGAWSAAWREMEKVDVEISVYLPEDIRREVENRLAAFNPHVNEEHSSAENQDDPYISLDGEQNAREREIYGGGGRSNTENTAENLHQQHRSGSPRVASADPPHLVQGLDFQVLLSKYLRIFLQDKKNVLIAMLSIAVVFFAMFSSMSDRNANSGISHPNLSTPQVLNSNVITSSRSVSQGNSPASSTRTPMHRDENWATDTTEPKFESTKQIPFSTVEDPLPARESVGADANHESTGNELRLEI